MAEERIYTIPLRKKFLKAPKWKRTKRSVNLVKEFLTRHTKKEVKIGKYLNELLWSRGMKNPPGKVKVKVIEDGEIVRAELTTAPIEAPIKIKEVKEVKKELKEEKGVKESLEEEKKKVLEKGLEKEHLKEGIPREIEKTFTKKEEEKFREEKIITDSKRRGHKRERK